jgi:hypothetical protein
MVRIRFEAKRLGRPCLADEFVWREAVKALEPAAEVIAGDEGIEVPPELVVTVVVRALDRRVLNGPVPPLDLAIGPGMIDAGKAVLDAVPGAGRTCGSDSGR